MASSTRRSTLLFAAASLLVAACNAGSGTGQVSGTVSAPSCGIDPADPFELRPTFFAAEAFRENLNIRLQGDGDAIDYANVLYVTVLDASEVSRSMLGAPLEIGDMLESPVRMSLALNETCDFHDRTTTPVSFQAVSGTIVFTSIYAPEVSDEKLIEATFDAVHFIDPADPATRYADLTGSFRFLWSRGRPAQEFP